MARGHFAKSEKQVASVMKEMRGKGNAIESVRTASNYAQSLKIYCDYLKEFKLGGLRTATIDTAKGYLDQRSELVGQKQLNNDRIAIQTMMQHVTYQLDRGEKLFEKGNNPVSQKETILESRSYTDAQIARIQSHQSEKHAFSTALARDAGLRAHELYTLRPPNEQPASIRTGEKAPHEGKFSHMNTERVVYTVDGKGGLIREVAISKHLAEQLEEKRLSHPVTIVDRGVNYQSHYDLVGGKQFSDGFSKASTRGLDYSNGAHGLRHSYVQTRYEQLANHYPRSDVMTIISQELGHFREDITEVYLR